jgi:predicted transcriptional regulator
MNAVKQEVTRLLNNLPEECTFEDIQYHLYVMQKIENGLKDEKKGNVYSQEEMEKRLSKKFLDQETFYMIIKRNF